MQHRIKLPIHEILVVNRQRLDLGDIESLATSLRDNGLIQPIVINQDKRLVAGGRRLAAAKLLKWQTIDVVYRETLSDDELHVLELEENIRRKDETWQERCLHIQTIHLLKKKLAAIDGESWGQRETCELLGVGLGASVNHALQIATILRSELGPDNKPAETARFWLCSSLTDAWRLWCRDREAEVYAELAKRGSNIESFEEEQVALSEFEQIEQNDDLLAAERERYYSNPHNAPGSFEQYWADKQAWAQQIRDTVIISNKFHCMDSIKYMLDPDNAGRFDHIITDIPYGIDMEMLNQQHPRGGMADIDTVEELHDVEYNKKLITDFFPAAYKCTKDRAFVITWCDQMLWQFMYDEAIEAGFAVQRWPITWVKEHNCMNQCIAYNTTKDTEIAIVCRKPGTTLSYQPNSSVIKCGRDELCDEVGHPFAKPFALWERLVEMATLEGQTILEPFMGRGSGIISILRLKRNVVGVELDRDHFNAALENIKRLHYLQVNPNFQFK